MARWSGLRRLLERAWDRYDDLGEWQRVGLGAAVALVLVASLFYTVGAASLIALARYQPPPPTEVPVGSPTPTLLPIATDVNPISPLLAERTPTARATVTRTPTGGALIPTPTRMPTGGALVATLTRTTTPTRGPSPTLGVVPRAAATVTPARGAAGLATPTRTPIRPATATPTRALR